MKMDIGKIAPRNFVLKIVDPGTNKFTGLSVELAPMSDPAFKAVERDITDMALQRRQRGKIIKSEERAENGIALLVAVVRGIKWENDADGKPASFQGEQLTFSEENVRKLIGVDWIRDQIEEGLSDQSNFFKR